MATSAEQHRKPGCIGNRMPSYLQFRSTKRSVMISFGLFSVVKVLVSILVVVLLSLIAEHAGPRVAGIVSGYPLGAAISLFFIGIEIDPAFAARGAIFTAAGLSATVAFLGGYLLGLKA